MYIITNFKKKFVATDNHSQYLANNKHHRCEAMTMTSVYESINICHVLPAVPQPGDLKFKKSVVWPLCAYCM